MTAKSPITTHVLDTALGKPAAGVPVALFAEGADTPLATGVTDADGRIGDLLPPGALAAGVYRLEFATAGYFQAQSADSFYPRVTVEFSISSAGEHYHVPLLLSPFGYSTYRGS